MTKGEAIRECKKLWAEIEKSGETKGDFLYHSPAGEVWRAKHYQGGCPLCEYSGNGCSRCPLVTQYGKKCVALGFHDFNRCEPEWFDSVRGLKL